jgi:hypothetical protein
MTLQTSSAQAIRHETDNYRLETERNGLCITLTRKRDGKSAFFQNTDDTSLWLRNIDAIEKTHRSDSLRLDRTFDFLCTSYDDLLS